MAEKKVTPFEKFWEEKEEILNSDKETAEIIWNSAVVDTLHDVISMRLYLPIEEETPKEPSK